MKKVVLCVESNENVVLSWKLIRQSNEKVVLCVDSYENVVLAWELIGQSNEKVVSCLKCIIQSDENKEENEAMFSTNKRTPNIVPYKP